MSNTEISLLDVDVSNLRKRQFDALKNHIICVLKNTAKIVQEENFKAVKDICFDSPAGDEMGSDNSCIDFGFNGKMLDFQEAMEMLKRLKDNVL